MVSNNAGCLFAITWENECLSKSHVIFRASLALILFLTFISVICLPIQAGKHSINCGAPLTVCCVWECVTTFFSLGKCLSWSIRWIRVRPNMSETTRHSFEQQQQQQFTQCERQIIHYPLSVLQSCGVVVILWMEGEREREREREREKEKRERDVAV